MVTRTRQRGCAASALSLLLRWMVSSWPSFKEDRFAREGVMEKRYRVTLTHAERQELRAMVSAGKAAARKLMRARVLLLADQAEGGPAKSDPEIIDALRPRHGRTHSQTVR